MRCWSPVLRALPATLLLCLLLAAPAAASPAPQWRGVTLPILTGEIPMDDIDRQVAAADRLGGNTLRVGVEWSLAQPTRRGFYRQPYLQRLDRLVVAARRRGMRPLLFVMRTPCWATSAPDAGPGCSERQRSHPPSDPADYGEFVGFLASRYRARLAGVEVWNEPDHANEFYLAGPDKPARYTALVKAAYAAAKKADRSLQVLAGSLVGADGRFLRALYAEGIRGHYDGLSVHFYDLSLASIRSIRAVQRDAGDTKPIWLNEFGWPSCYPARRSEGGHDCVSRAQQGRNLTDLFRAFKGKSYVRGALLYHLRDRRNDHFGVTDSNGRDKPAFAAVRRAFSRTLPGPRAPTARRSGGRVSGSAPAGDVVEIVARRRSDGRYAYQAFVAPDRFGRYSHRLPSAVAGSGFSLLVRQPWTGRRARVTD